MKKNILIVLAATAAYSYLFYEQSPGLNHLVFSTVLTTLFALNNPLAIRDKRWLLAAGVYLLSGVMTAINGTDLNFLLNLGGIILLTFVTAAPELSIITGMAYATASGFSSIGLSLVTRFIDFVSNKPSEEKKPRMYKWYYLVIPLAALTLFILLYRNVSPAFTDLTNHIDLSFVSLGWIVFTFIGFHFLYGLFNPPAQLNFVKREANIPNRLEKSPRWITRGFNFTGITLFFLLDLLLLVVNLTDMVYLFVMGKEKTGMSHSELIHQGIDALSISIVFAVLFILVWLNQLKDQEGLHKKLKYAALIWVVLNVVLVATNVFKNTQYIEAHGLTYKRIGVYFFLTLALLTLLFCWSKIRGAKTNFFIYRRFGLALLLTCLLFNAFNWDKVIAKYNIARYKAGRLAIDTPYMINLSDDCLPLLVENRGLLNPYHDLHFDETLDLRCRTFLFKFHQKDWQSRTLNNYFTQQYLENNIGINNTTARVEP